MNYCDKIHYSHLTASAADFPAMIDDLLSRMPKKGTVLRLVLFGVPFQERNVLLNGGCSGQRYVRFSEVANRRLAMFYNRC